MKQVLMSRTNTAGWKLEELAAQLREELKIKNENIADDESDTAKQVTGNNNLIISLLEQIERLQLLSIEACDAIGPNNGPTGTPRIGK